eukprot:PhM_4_TR1309/c0_g1_i1/m.105529
MSASESSSVRPYAQSHSQHSKGSEEDGTCSTPIDSELTSCLDRDLPKAKMYKPRSVKTEQGSIMKSLRTLGGGSWQARYVWTHKGKLCYGAQEKDTHNPEKAIPYEVILECGNVSTQQMRSLGCPEKYVDCGFFLKSEEKELHWACESVSVRDQWVAHFKAIVFSFSPEGAATRAKAEQEAAAAAAAAAARSVATPSDIGDLEDLDDFTNTTNGVRTQKELRNMVVGEDEDEDEDQAGVMDDLDADEDEDDSDDDDDDFDVEELMQDVTMVSKQLKRDEREMFLLGLAETPHVHLPQKTASFLTHMTMGEKEKDIVFSRTVAKISSKDTASNRDLIVTTKGLYILGSTSLIKNLTKLPTTRCVKLEHIIGVVESSVETNLFAVIIPSYHDILLRIIPQRSAVAGSEEDVKNQLIGHLFACTTSITHNQPFIFRSNENIRRCIRRSEEDRHMPLESSPKDKLGVARSPQLYPALRVNADSRVFCSFPVSKLNVKFQRENRGFVITDLAIYLLNQSQDGISKRVGFADLFAVFYDADERLVLLKARPSDQVIQISRDEDFELFITLIPEVYRLCAKRDLLMKAKSEKILLAMAQFSAGRDPALALMDHSREGMLKGVKLTQRLLKKAGSTGLDGVGALLDVGVHGFDFLARGVVGVGEMMTEDIARIAAQRGGVVQHWDYDPPETTPATVDALNLCDTHAQALLQNGIKQLLFSTMGQKIHLARALGQLGSEMHDMRRSDKIFVLSNDSFYLVDDPNASANFTTQITRGAMSLFASKKTPFNIDNQIKFQHIVAICGCRLEQNMFAILCTDDHSHDYLIRIPSLHNARAFYALIFTQFRQVMGRPLPMWNAETPDHLKNVCRRTKLDTLPKIAMRFAESDYLCVAVNDALIDRFRRYGDTKVLFSYQCERPKTATVKNLLHGDMEGLTDELTNAAGAVLSLMKDQKLKKEKRKSVNVVITNAAFYLCGSDWAVQRRIDVRSISHISTEVDDPDSILIVVLTEYDTLVCTHRSKELIERLQDARLFWTCNDAYRKLTGRQNEDLRIPIRTSPSNLVTGRLEKPGILDGISAKKPDVTRQELSGIVLEALLKSAYDEMPDDIQDIPVPSVVRAQKLGFADFAVLCGGGSDRATTTTTDKSDGDDDDNDEADEQGETATARSALMDQTVSNVNFAPSPSASLTTNREQSQKRRAPKLRESPYLLESLWHNEKRIVTLEKDLERANIAEVPDTCDKVVRAKKELGACLRRRVLARSLRDALAAEETEQYDSLRDEAETLGGLEQLFDDYEPYYEFVQQKKSLTEDIRTEIEFNATIDAGSLCDPSTALVMMYGRALDMGVSTEELRALRTQFDLRVQKELTLNYLAELQQIGDLGAARAVARRRAMQKVAESIGVEMPAQGVSTSTMLAQRSVRMIQTALDSGSVRRLEESLVFAKKNAPNPCPSELSKLMQIAEEELGSLSEREKASTAVSAFLMASYDPEKSTIEELEAMVKRAEVSVKQAERFRGLRALVMRATVRVGRVKADITKMRNLMKLRQQDENLKAELERARAQRAEIRRVATAGAKKKAEEDAKRREEDVVTNMSKHANELVAALNAAIEAKRTSDVRGLVTELRSAIDSLGANTFRYFQRQAREVDALLRDAIQQGSSTLANAAARGASGVLFEEAVKCIQANDKDGFISIVQNNVGRWSVGELERLKALWRTGEEQRRKVAQATEGLQLAAHRSDGETGKDHLTRLGAAIRFAVDSGVSRDLIAESETRLHALEQERGRESGMRSPIPSVKATAPKDDGSNDDPTEHAAATASAASTLALTLQQTDMVSFTARHPLVDTVYKDLTSFFTAEDAATTTGDDGITRVIVSTAHPLCNKHATNWDLLLSHRLKPSGLIRKTERTTYDVFVEAAKITSKVEGRVLPGAPRVSHALREFERVKKYNQPRGLGNSILLIQYVLQEGLMDTIIGELTRLHGLIKDIYFPDALMSSPDLCNDIKRVSSTLLPRVQFKFNFCDEQDLGATIGSEMLGATLSAAETAVAIRDSSVGSTANAASGGNASPQIALRSLRAAIQRLNVYFSTSLNDLRKSTALAAHNNKTAAAATQRVPVARLLDESLNKKVGILIREHLCTSLVALCMVGFKEGTMFKKHLWDFFVASANRMKESARDLGGIGFPVAMEVVSALVEKQKSRKGSALSRRSDREVNDMKCRAILCYGLNNQQLGGFFDALYDMSNQNLIFVKNYYIPVSSPLLNAEVRDELNKILMPLSRLPFALQLDAELW